MKIQKKTSLIQSFAAALVLAVLGACASAPQPAEIADARRALEEARAARAEQLAARPYDEALRHLSVAETTWRQSHNAETSAHWARRAEAAARRAQFEAEAITAEEEIRLQTERRNRAEIAVRDAEIARLHAQGRSEAEARALEAEREAARARRRAEEESERRQVADEQARREAEARASAEAQAREERLRREEELSRREAETEARLEAERRRAEEQRQAEEARTAELERLRQEQERTREELRTTLSRLAEVREEARGLVVTLPGSIYFATNKSVVQPAMRSRLQEIARALAGSEDSTILIEGHTDSDGSNEYNLELSRLRAEAVRSVLVGGGVPAGRIETQGYGETRPVSSNSTASGKAQNRRVEIIIQGGAAASR